MARERSTAKLREHEHWPGSLALASWFRCKVPSRQSLQTEMFCRGLVAFPMAVMISRDIRQSHSSIQVTYTPMSVLL